MDWRQQVLCCYACGAVAAVSCADLASERAQWPAVACEATPGCPGAMVPNVHAVIGVAA